jgi:hypothetical protein
MTPYNAIDFEPPAPVANVTLRYGKNEWLNVPMQIDLGADITLVPQAVVAKLNLQPIANKQYELQGFDGHATLAEMVQLELIFCQRTFRGQFLLIDQPWGILGRNVLNAVPVVFDGPRLQWFEYTITK